MRNPAAEFAGIGSVTATMEIKASLSDNPEHAVVVLSGAILVAWNSVTWDGER